MVGLVVMEVVAQAEFDAWDQAHYSMENKLLGLVRSLEAKREAGGWGQNLPPSEGS